MKSKKVVNILGKIEESFLGYLLLLIVALLFINVILRFFGMALDWTDEFARYGIIWVTFIGAGACVVKGGHIGVDAIVTLLSDRNRKILNLIIGLIIIVFMIVFIQQSSLLVIRAFNMKQLSPTLEINMAYVYAAMPLGGLLMLIRYINEWLNIIRSLFVRGEER